MKLFTSLFLSMAIITQLAAETKIATVDMSRIFIECKTIVAEEEKLQNKLKKMAEDPRITKINEEREKLTQDQQNLITSSAPPAELKKLRADLQGRIRELQALQKDASEEFRLQQREIQKHIIEVSRENLKTMRVIINKYAKQNGYSFVMDTTAMSNSRLPAILFLKTSTDITDDIVKLVNEQE